MKTAEFFYTLPEELIAQHPKKKRTDSRLMVVDAEGKLCHDHFNGIRNHLNPGDLLVVNNTQTIAARLFGKDPDGESMEILVERLECQHEALARISGSRLPNPGSHFFLSADAQSGIDPNFRVDVLYHQGLLSRLSFSQPVLKVLNTIGHRLMPPNINPTNEETDSSCIQNVYEKTAGSVATPTAGLHFDNELLSDLQTTGIEIAEITLHVGPETFQSVAASNIIEHKMHSEWVCVKDEVCRKVIDTKSNGGRVVAVGTTSVRALEAAALSGEIKPFTGDTDIFLYPGKSFQCVDMIITNFHLPRSTLLMMVSAFCGVKTIRNAYNVAIQKKYRFYSYGDAMLLHKSARPVTQSQ